MYVCLNKTLICCSSVIERNYFDNESSYGLYKIYMPCNNRFQHCFCIKSYYLSLYMFHLKWLPQQVLKVFCICHRSPCENMCTCVREKTNILKTKNRRNPKLGLPFQELLRSQTKVSSEIHETRVRLYYMVFPFSKFSQKRLQRFSLNIIYS